VLYNLAIEDNEMTHSSIRATEALNSLQAEADYLGGRGFIPIVALMEIKE
jgi:hypothetical protein